MASEPGASLLIAALVAASWLGIAAAFIRLQRGVVGRRPRPVQGLAVRDREAASFTLRDYVRSYGVFGTVAWALCFLILYVTSFRVWEIAGFALVIGAWSGGVLFASQWRITADEFAEAGLPAPRKRWAAINLLLTVAVSVGYFMTLAAVTGALVDLASVN